MISVIIPTYNRANKIENSVRSVLNQTYKDLELIIVDDGSKDDTKSVIDSIKDSRIRYCCQENAGACAARNKGIKLSNGEYIAFHDSDDIWLPEKLSRQLQTMEKTGADIIFCQLRRLKAGERTRYLPEMDQSGFIAYNDLMVGIGTQALLMKRVVAEDFSFDDRAPRYQDMEWLLRAAKKYTVYGMKEPLVDYYLSSDSISLSSEKVLAGVELIYKKNPGLVKEVPKINRELRKYVIYVGTMKMKNGEKGYIPYLKLGFSMSQNPKDRMKYIAVCMGLFKPIYMLKHWLDSITKKGR